MHSQETRPISNLNSKLLKLEFLFLALFIFSLPSFEAPKNIFWVFFFITALVRLFYSFRNFQVQTWDVLFFALVLSAFLTTIFPGFKGYDEWKGFKDLLMYTSIGWLIYRSNYSKKQLNFLLIFIIISTIPPLLWGIWLKIGPINKEFLELNSVGHVNHSAIYLTMTFGISLSLLISNFNTLWNFKKIILLTICILFFISIVISQSRAALGVTVLITVFLIFSIAKANFKRVSLIFLVAILTGIYFIQPVVLQKQVTLNHMDNVLSGRSEVFNVSLEASKWAPLLGLGMSNWKQITAEQVKQSIEVRGEVYKEKNYLFVGHSHNLFLTVLVERGYIGLASLISLLIAWLITLIKYYSKIDQANNLTFWASSLSAWLVTVVIGTVNTTLHHEHGALTFIILGIFLTNINKNQT